MSDSTELVTINEKTALAAFSGGTIDAVLEKVATEARAQVLDVTTPTGRKFIGSLAHKVARSKTALDDMGKDLVSEWKQKAKVVDAERKKARDFLDNLKAEIRQPLTDFEEQEKKRVADLEARVADLQGMGEMRIDATATEVQARLDTLLALKLGDDWQEYRDRAGEVRDAIIAYLTVRQEAEAGREANQLELARLREEAAERQRKEAEDIIRAAAAEKAKRAAEDEARVAAERVEIERRAEESRARAHAEELERQKQRAIAEAEDARLAAAAAAANERRRIEAEQEAEVEAARQREANRTHRAKINRAAVTALREHGLSDEDAKATVIAIASGAIPNVTISY